jgi:hypothetical protein
MKKTIYAFFVFVMASCGKSIEKLSPESNNYNNTEKREATSPEEIKIVNDIKKITPILKELYKNRQIIQEINSAILSQYYKEEQILLSDLLYPDNSSLYKNNRITNKGLFSKEYRRIYNEMYGKPQPAVSINSLASSGFSSDGYLDNFSLGIYFPYSENFAQIEVNQVALTPTEYEADFGEGFIFDHNVNTFAQVLVNDDYAFVNPVHIITQLDNMDINDTKQFPPIVLRPQSNPPVLRVFHGFGRLTRQLDPLIGFVNSGGSEMVIGRISGYLERTDGHVKDFKGDLARLHYTRKAIREHRWVRAYSIWDTHWRVDDKEQVYCAYEEDNTGSTKFSGKVKTKLVTGVEAEIGFDITVKTEDPIQAQVKQDRSDYLRTARQDQGHGFLSNPADNTFLTSGYWPIYNGGAATNWSWTWPFNWY